MWVKNVSGENVNKKHKSHINNLIVAIAVQSVVPNMIIKIAKIIQIARPLIF